MYFLITHINEARYQRYLIQVSELTLSLVTKGVNRQKPETRERWLNLVASLMDVDIELSSKQQGFRNSGIVKRQSQYAIIGERELAKNWQVTVITNGLTEKWLSATAFLALNELGHVTVDKRGQVFNEIKTSSTFPVDRVRQSSIELTTKQLRQLERGDTVLVRSANLGQPEWISAYAPWGNTGDALSIGPIPFFQPYPIYLLLPALFATLLLIALTVWLLINHLRKRIQQIEKTVDAIQPSHFSDDQLQTDGDAINQLNQRIMNMQSRITHLLDEQAYMVRAVSHDLRTPIAKLHFRLETIAMMLDDDNDLISQCKRDINNLNSLIDELLTYERLTDQSDIILEPLNLLALIEEEISETALLYRQLNFTLTTSNYKPALVDGNRVLLKRLLANLLINAGKYAKSTIEIELATRPKLLTITVRDDGVGFEQKTIESVFKPFFKADKARTTDQGQASHGLGLAIAKQIVSQHQGTITAANQLNGGACLTVELPCLTRTNKLKGSN